MKRILFPLAGLAGLSLVGPAQGLPKYADAEGKPCAYCHVRASGGGPRNYRGLFYAANKFTFYRFDDAAEAKKAGAEVGPSATPPPRSLNIPPQPEAPAPPPVDVSAVPDFGAVTVDGIAFIKIPAGMFSRGTSEAARAQLEKVGLWNRLFSVEMPVREVRISRPFLIGKVEVTQEQWETVMEGTARPGGKAVNPSAFKGKTLPVDSVSWNEAQQFCKRLSAKSKARYRLPTEAEWEYAARAGGDGPFGNGADKAPFTPDSLTQYAWMNGNADNKTHPVGTAKPNAWGLYDMLGNVWEWCQDAYLPDAYTQLPLTDPLCQSPNATERVLRGGCWFLDKRAQRVALRGGNLPTLKNAYVGFRVVREP